MKPFQLLAAALLSLSLAGPALAAADPAQYVLTQAVYNKMLAIEKESQKLKHKDKDEDGDNDASVEGIMKSIDSDPAARALLARHGLSSKEFALASLAAMHAGFALMAESMMDKKAKEKAMAGYTKAQQQNINFLRPLAKMEK
jgi:hypothetical protein